MRDACVLDGHGHGCTSQRGGQCDGVLTQAPKWCFKYLFNIVFISPTKRNSYITIGTVVEQGHCKQRSTCPTLIGQDISRKVWVQMTR